MGCCRSLEFDRARNRRAIAASRTVRALLPREAWAPLFWASRGNQGPGQVDQPSWVSKSGVHPRFVSSRLTAQSLPLLGLFVLIRRCTLSYSFSVAASPPSSAFVLLNSCRADLLRRDAGVAAGYRRGRRWGGPLADGLDGRTGLRHQEGPRGIGRGDRNPGRRHLQAGRGATTKYQVSPETKSPRMPRVSSCRPSFFPSPLPLAGCLLLRWREKIFFAENVFRTPVCLSRGR